MIGEIPSCASFAGQVLDECFPGGSLWACENCYLFFRYPRPAWNDVKRLYQSGHAMAWAASGLERKDWQLIKNWLQGRAGLRSVLDVGCFDGGFLQFLGGNYERYGLELNPNAAEKAEKRGVCVVAEDLDRIRSIETAFDLVTAIDVIEHVPDPRSFLADLSTVTHPGGYIVVATGNTDAITWRVMGSRYWYCHIAEHISFINPRWVNHHAKELGLLVERIEFFSHAPLRGSLQRFMREAVGNALLRVAPQAFAFLRRHGWGNIDVKSCPQLIYTPPYWMSARDHMLVILRKLPEKP